MTEKEKRYQEELEHKQRLEQQMARARLAIFTVRLQSAFRGYQGRKKAGAIKNGGRDLDQSDILLGLGVVTNKLFSFSLSILLT